jgi:hypothetical protein
VKLCLNGHEWAKRQLDKRHISYEALDNGFLSRSEPVKLQEICDALGPRTLTGSQQFKSFVEAARCYIDLSKGDPLIHRKVAQAINGLADFLEVERKRVPGDVLSEAERLECLLFGDYDPHFEGDEPPGL